MNYNERIQSDTKSGEFTVLTSTITRSHQVRPIKLNRISLDPPSNNNRRTHNAPFFPCIFSGCVLHDHMQERASVGSPSILQFASSTTTAFRHWIDILYQLYLITTRENGSIDSTVAPQAHYNQPPQTTHPCEIATKSRTQKYPCK